MDLRVARHHALVTALASLAALPGRVSADVDVIDLPDTLAQLSLDTRAWRATPRPGLVAGFTTERNERLAVTRAQIPNIDAWRAKTRDAYVAQIVAGLVALGYKPSTKKLTTIEGVPVLDLEATHARGPLVMRVILFRTYALSLAIEVPTRSARGAARTIAKTFVPPPTRPEGSP